MSDWALDAAHHLISDEMTISIVDAEDKVMPVGCEQFLTMLLLVAALLRVTLG